MKLVTKCIKFNISMGVRREEQKGAFPPAPSPLAGQNSMFFDFFSKENTVVCFCPPLEKKSADAHEYRFKFQE